MIAAFIRWLKRVFPPEAELRERGFYDEREPRSVP